jgi:large subunit ribosomal protein L4
MQTVAVYDKSGKAVGEIALSDAVFGAEINKTALYMAVKNYLANQRQGTHSTLTRAEVSGGGRKPWRQKGTGRARHGSTRSPQWTHGGVALGPKPRTYRFTINKKLKRTAILSALSSKVKEGNLIVMEDLKFDSIKTKPVVEMLGALGAKKALLVSAVSDTVLVKSARNIEGVKTAPVNAINVYDILKYDKLILAKDAVAKLEEVYA